MRALLQHRSFTATWCNGGVTMLQEGQGMWRGLVASTSGQAGAAKLASSGAEDLEQQPCQFGRKQGYMDLDIRRQRRIAQRYLIAPDAYRACLIDAAGTLLVPSESTADVYHRHAVKYSKHPPSSREILDRFRRAYNKPWGLSPTRYVGDGRPFWSHIVAESTGVSNPAMFEELYQYYARPEAWRLAPGAAEALRRIRDGGVALAVVSNFDTRLRPLLADLNIDHLFDAIIVSAEVGWEKPNRCIFDAALDALGMAPQDTVHIGDDRRNDVWGARDAGVHAWLWGTDVTSFDQLAYRVIHGTKLKQWDDDEDDDEESQVGGAAVRPDT